MNDERRGAGRIELSVRCRKISDRTLDELALESVDIG
jgi:hypothetical protein